MNREFKLNREKLNEEYSKAFKDIEIRIGLEFFNRFRLKEVKKEILAMFIESQERGLKVEEVVGRDIEEFCNELLEENKMKFSYFILEIILITIAIFSLLEFFFSMLEYSSKTPQFLYPDSKGIYRVHYAYINKTTMLDITSLLYGLSVTLLIIISSLLSRKRVFKVKNIRIFNSIFVGSGMVIIIMARDYIKSLLLNKGIIPFVEVKIDLFLIIFIISSLAYFYIFYWREKKRQI